MEHKFIYKGQWAGDLSGQGVFESGKLAMKISAPAEMNGKGVGTNPEELLISAASSCYLITLAGIFQFKNIEVEKIELESEAEFKVGMEGPIFSKITYYPKIMVDTINYEKYKNEIENCILKAKQSCMVSKAIHSNVMVEVNGDVIPLVK